MADTGPSKSLLSRLFSSFGKKEQTDIELPNESGKRDPYLPKEVKKKKKKTDSILANYNNSYNPFKRIGNVISPDKDE